MASSKRCSRPATFSPQYLIAPRATREGLPNSELHRVVVVCRRSGLFDLGFAELDMLLGDRVVFFFVSLSVIVREFFLVT